MYQRSMESLREENIMNSRERFLEELEQELSNISKTERDEALQYYREYFEDANMPDEDVIRQLGSVTSVADSIREELADKEVAIYDSRRQEQSWTDHTSSAEDGWKNVEGKRKENAKKSLDTWVIVLIVVLGVIFSPVLLGVGASILGVFVSVIVTVFAIFIAVAVCAIAFAIAAVASFVAAVANVAAEPLLGVLFLGICMFFAGLCFLCTLSTMKMTTCVIPEFIKGIGKLFSAPFRKKETGIV